MPFQLKIIKNIFKNDVDEQLFLMQMPKGYFPQLSFNKKKKILI